MNTFYILHIENEPREHKPLLNSLVAICERILKTEDDTNFIDLSPIGAFDKLDNDEVLNAEIIIPWKWNDEDVAINYNFAGHAENFKNKKHPTDKYDFVIVDVMSDGKDSQLKNNLNNVKGYVENLSENLRIYTAYYETLIKECGNGATLPSGVLELKRMCETIRVPLDWDLGEIGEASLGDLLRFKTDKDGDDLLYEILTRLSEKDLISRQVDDE